MGSDPDVPADVYRSREHVLPVRGVQVVVEGGHDDLLAD